MTDFFVDNTLHLNADSVGQLSAVVDASNFTLASGSSWTTNEIQFKGILLTSGSFAGESVKVSTNDTGGVILSTTSFSGVPSVGDSYEVVSGAEINNGLTATVDSGLLGPKDQVQDGHDAISNGDTLFVKAGRNYKAFEAAATAVLIPTAGVSTAFKQAEGFLTTPGDRAAHAVLDGGGTILAFDAASGSNFNFFVSIDATDSTGSGFGTATADNIVFLLCGAFANAVGGFVLDNNIKCIRCQSRNNTGRGFQLDAAAIIASCVSHTNTTEGIRVNGTNCQIANTLIYGNTGIGIAVVNDALIANVTIVGGTNGIEVIGLAGFPTVFNSILSNGSGFGLAGAVGPDRDENHNCIFNFASGARQNWPTGLDTIEVDPKFVNAAGDDYRLAQDSPCVGIGVNLDTILGRTSNLDIGAHQTFDLGPVKLIGR